MLNSSKPAPQWSGLPFSLYCADMPSSTQHWCTSKAQTRTSAIIDASSIHCFHRQYAHGYIIECSRTDSIWQIKSTLPTLWRGANCVVTLASTTLSMTVATCRMLHSKFPPQRLQLTGYSSGARPSHLAANFPSPCRCSVIQSPQEFGSPSSASTQVCLNGSSLDSSDKEEIIQISFGNNKISA